MRHSAVLSVAVLTLSSLTAVAQSTPNTAKELLQSSAPPRVARVAQTPPIHPNDKNPSSGTPPMGWNSWNFFHGNVTDQDIRNAADQLVSTGMKDAGYIYVNIDDTWEGERDANGVLHTNSKFPDMKGLADYVHSKGLKLGIYSSPGPKTCAGFEGSLDHEVQDAELYASWGVDYLKYDLCSYRESVMATQAPDDKAQQMRLMFKAYAKMDKALKATGRPIVYSLCQYGWDAVWEWGPKVGANLWRTTNDIKDNYTSLSQNGFTQAGLARFAGPGHWNDPDMLEVGNPNFKPVDNFTQMSLWCLLAAPLIAGNDLTNMPPEIQSILCNREVIAVDQDPAGIQGNRVSCEGPLEVWMKPLADGSKAVGLFNRGRSLMNMTLRFVDVGFHGRVQVRDLWEHLDRGVFEDNYSTLVPKHGVVLVKVRVAT